MEDINMRFTLCFVFMLALNHHDHVVCCEVGWTPYVRVKACFKAFLNKKMDWSDARDYCHSQKSYLTDMADFTEQKFISDTLLGTQYINHGVWLGAADKGTKVWRWVGGEHMNIDLFLWRPGNPDNGKIFFELPNIGENCLELTTEPGYRGMLNDYKCDRRLGFVCKNRKMFNRSLTSPTPTSTSTSPYTLSSSTTSNETNNLPREPSGTGTTPVIVTSLVVILVVLILVFVVLIIWRRKRQKHVQSTNTYADTAELSQNEHMYTSLETVGRHGNNTDSYLQPSCPQTGSKDNLLRDGYSGYSEPNFYDNPMEERPRGLQSKHQCNGSQRTTESELQNENTYVELGEKREHRGPLCKGNVAIKPTKITGSKPPLNNKDSPGYVDMDNGYYEEIKNAKFKSRDQVSCDNNSSDNTDSVSDYYVELSFRDTGRGANNGVRKSTYYITPTSEKLPKRTN